jgi:NAD-dependent SIR2 family protein deacetylase
MPTEEALESCDICLVIGTSSIVYPAAMFAPMAARRGIPVAEFNLEKTPETYNFQYVSSFTMHPGTQFAVRRYLTFRITPHFRYSDINKSRKMYILWFWSKYIF